MIYTPVKNSRSSVKCNKGVKLTADQMGEIFEDGDIHQAIQSLGDKLGFEITVDQADHLKMHFAEKAALAMDAVNNLVTTPSMPTENNALSAYLNGTVLAITAKNTSSYLLGEVIVGSWFMDTIKQKILEHIGAAKEYSDFDGIETRPTFNSNMEKRNIVRFQSGFRVGELERNKDAAGGINSVLTKRQAAIISLNKAQDDVQIYGWRNGDNLTYGWLNDPSLPAYVTLPNGASGKSTFADLTYKEQQNRITAGLTALRKNSGDQVDPEIDPIELHIASDVVDVLSDENEQGKSIRKWLAEVYPNVTIKSSRVFNGAHGGDNVFYLFATSVGGTGDDGGATVKNLIVTKARNMSVYQQHTIYEEKLMNASAGAMVCRPFAVYRASGC